MKTPEKLRRTGKKSWVHKQVKKGTVFHAIKSVVHDEDYEPENECEAVSHAPGCSAKVQVLADRIASGQPLWVDGDKNDFEGVDAEAYDGRTRDTPSQIFSLNRHKAPTMANPLTNKDLK